MILLALATSILALGSQSADMAGDESRQLMIRFMLLPPEYGYLEKRKPGPLPKAVARPYVSALRSRLENSPAIRPPDYFQNLYSVLTASDRELGQMLNSSQLASFALEESLLRRRSLNVERICNLAKLPRLQLLAIGALGSIGTKQSMSCLAKMLRSSSALMRTAAAFDLAANGINTGSAQLWWALRNDVMKQLYFDAKIRGRVALALVQLGAINTRAQLDEIFKYTQSEGRFICPVLASKPRSIYLQKLRDLVVDMAAYHGVRKWAAIALGNVRDRGAVRQLERAAASDPALQVRAAAEAALLKIGMSMLNPPVGVVAMPAILCAMPIVVGWRL